MILASVGGSGSLGNAILRQQDVLKEMGITKIRILSRDDQKHVKILRTYTGEIPLDCYIADITDRERMKFALRDVDYCIHAAALKHVDRFELDIPTGYESNIKGTENVAHGFMNSSRANAGVFISTDKAADPCTAYGISKLAAEHLWKWHNTYQKMIRMNVARYGNIFGSNGSVIETWTKLAKARKPLPVTDIRCTRFFMSTDSAARFVLSALHKEPGIYIPKMKSIPMIKVAEFIWNQFNDKEFQYFEVGIREKEKLHEILETGGLSSEKAERLSSEELIELYEGWKKWQSA